jgi:hypothetical protein
VKQFRTVRAANSLAEAQAVMDVVRDAYKGTPGAMLISSISLSPLELLVVDGATSQYYRVPVTVNDDGSLSFGAPIATTGPGGQSYPDPPGTVRPNVPGGSPSLPAPTSSQASRGVSDRDRARIAAAVARGAVPAGRAAHWEARAARGEDISMIDALTGGLVSPGAGKADAAASVADADYRRLFGPAARHDSPGPEYSALFGSTPEAAQRALDQQEAAATHTLASLTDDQLYTKLFGQEGSQ